MKMVMQNFLFKYSEAVSFLTTQRGFWFEFVGHSWQEDILNQSTAATEEIISIYADETGRQALKRLKAEKNGNHSKAEEHKEIESQLLKRIRALHSVRRKADVLTLARSGRKSLGITGQEWERDPWLLGCRNGVIDLKTGTIRPGTPTDFIKNPTPTQWLGIDEPAPNWERFLNDVFEGQSEILGFLRRLLGYCITGQTTEHIFPIFWGAGRNGKSTLLETLSFILGPLTGTLKAETILRQTYIKNASGPSPDIMALQSKRLIWFS